MSKSMLIASLYQQEKRNIDELKSDLEKVKDIHITRFPYNDFYFMTTKG